MEELIFLCVLFYPIGVFDQMGLLEKYILLDLLNLSEAERLMVKELKHLIALPHTKLLLVDILRKLSLGDSILKSEGRYPSI